MVVVTELDSQGSDSSSDSNSHCFEIRLRDKPIMSEEMLKLSMILWADESKPKIDQTKDVVCEKHETVCLSTNMEIDNGEKEKTVEDVSDDLCVLEDALEATIPFKGLSKYQQKFMVRNLKNLGVKKRKELTDEWKALLLEELQLNIKKQTFSAKLANP